MLRKFHNVSCHGRSYKAEIEKDGAVIVHSHSGVFLGWINAAGVSQSLGGLDEGLRDTVEEVYEALVCAGVVQ